MPMEQCRLFCQHICLLSLQLASEHSVVMQSKSPFTALLYYFHPMLFCYPVCLEQQCMAEGYAMHMHDTWPGLRCHDAIAVGL